MVWLRSGLAYFFHGTQEGPHHPYLPPSYPAASHAVVCVKQCGVTDAGLLKQVSLHGMQARAGKRETRVVAVTGSREVPVTCQTFEDTTAKAQKKSHCLQRKAKSVGDGEGTGKVVLWLVVFVLVLGNHLLSCQTQPGFFPLLFVLYIILFSVLLKLTLLKEIKSSCCFRRKTSERWCRCIRGASLQAVWLPGVSGAAAQALGPPLSL